MSLTIPNQETLDKIRHKNNLTLILLHGSHVDGKIHEKSDIDIGVFRHNSNKTIDIISLIGDLCKAFSSDRIDLSDITHADPLFLYAVTAKSKLLSGSPNELSNLHIKAFKLYQDFQPYLKIEGELIRKHMKKYVTT